MKRKLLLAMAFIASAFGFTAYAQEDITSTYLTNADLSTENTGWTYYSDAYTYTAWRTTNNETLVPAVEFYAGWGALENTNFRFSQTITLPAGDYRIAVNAFYREGNDGDGTNNNKAWIFAGDKKQNVYAMTQADINTLRNYTSGDDMNDAMAMFHDGRFSNAFDFSLESATDISIGFEGVFNTMRSWCILGPVKLYKYSLEDYLGDYDSKYAEAQALDGKPMNAAVQAALTAAMVDRSTFSLSSQVTAAIRTLTEAMEAAKASTANYAAIKAVIDANAAKLTTMDSYANEAYNAAAAEAISAYENGTATDGAAEIAALKAALKAAILAIKQPTDGQDMTAYIKNPDFEGTYEGWTTEIPYAGNCGLQNNSRMEYWAGSATDRAKASFNIYQEIYNLPAGAYTISADMFNSLNGEGGAYTVFKPTCGVYGSSANEEHKLVDVEGDVLNTYTTAEVIVYEGKVLTIGTKNFETPMAARWFLFDNMKLTYARQLTEEEIAASRIKVNSISLDQTSANLTVLETVAINATVGPDDAADKSIAWTTSDAQVAIVSNEGVITAVGAGTATITATANGGENISATVDVTVTDVDAAEAPAYYSEIAEGDFYIVNAATGKYLGGANAWGTQASQIEHGIPFTATKIGDGVYTLDSHTYNNANDHFVNGTYVDGAATNLYITAVGNGAYTISTAETSAYMLTKPGTTIVDNSGVSAKTVLAQWYFVSKADRDQLLPTATAENPVDATYYIKQADISRNLSAGALNENAWNDYETQGDNSNWVGQRWHEQADVYQTITGLPNGTYTLTVQAFTTGEATFYANEQEVAVLPNSENISSAANAAKRFVEKAFTNTLNVTVTNNTLKIGLKGDMSSAWLVYDNFELYMTQYGITLDENVDYVAGSVTNAAVTLKRTIVADVWNTFVVPFAISNEDLVKAFGEDVAVAEFSEVPNAEVEGNSTIEFNTMATPAVEANVPVLIKAAAGTQFKLSNREFVAGEAKISGTNFDFVGNYQASAAVAAGDYILYNNELRKATANNTVKGTRAYLANKNGGEVKLYIDGLETSIAAINGEEAEQGNVYNLAGQRVQKAQKGIYVVNGKKVLVK